MAEWNKIRLGDIVKINQNTYSQKEKWGYVNYLDTGNLTMNKVDSIQYIDLSKERLPSRAKRKVKYNSIVYSTVRPNQLHYGIIKEQPENFLVSTGFVVIDVDCDVANPDYIYYILTQREITEHLQAIGEQSVSAYPSIKPSDIEDLEIYLPSIGEQEKIVAILSAIDEKERNNIAINNNLAEQSQAILKRYMDSCDYTLTPLGELAEIIDCLHSKKPNSVNDTTKQLLQLNNITDSGFLDLSTKYYISESDYENWTRKCEIIEGDCVITNVGRIGAVSQAPVGTHAAMGRNMTCIRLKKNKPYYSYLITVLLSNHISKEIMKNTDEGTIMGALNVKNIPLLLLPVFSNEIMRDLENTLHPIRKAIEYNYLANQTLGNLRDSLLPKLMSGDIDVSTINI